jgi:hypothetical protein
MTIIQRKKTVFTSSNAKAVRQQLPAQINVSDLPQAQVIPFPTPIPNPEFNEGRYQNRETYKDYSA